MSFQQGLSGLNASSKNIEIIGNNVANASTFGAKSSRAEFADVYANALNGAGVNTIGIGVNLASVAQQFTQGNITTTENPLDLAINGSGFFQVSDGKNPTMYTRNGQFKIDRQGFVINNQQQKLLGYPVDANGTIKPGEAQPIKLPTQGIDPTPTNRIDLELNLDSRSPNTENKAALDEINFNDPKTYNNATSVTVYDIKGQPVALTYYFQKTDTDKWNVYITANGTSLANTGTGANAKARPVASVAFPVSGAAPMGSTVTPLAEGAPGSVTVFDKDFANPKTSATGLLSLPDIPAVKLAGGGTSEPILGVNLSLSSVFQYGSAFGVTNVQQNGYAPGQLAGLNIEDNGVITARYSNGKTRAAGQLEFASFRNPQGLQALGGNAWAATFSSGEPVRGAPGDGNFGVLQSGALEESNIDLTGELVNMITAQRIYQANAQTIKTQDQILQTLVNIR